MTDPFARPTEADRERWLRATQDGTLPRICLVPLEGDDASDLLRSLRGEANRDMLGDWDA